jgi:hypothetical protein
MEFASMKHKTTQDEYIGVLDSLSRKRPKLNRNSANYMKNSVMTSIIIILVTYEKNNYVDVFADQLAHIVQGMNKHIHSSRKIIH